MSRIEIKEKVISIFLIVTMALTTIGYGALEVFAVEPEDTEITEPQQNEDEIKEGEDEGDQGEEESQDEETDEEDQDEEGDEIITFSEKEFRKLSRSKTAKAKKLNTNLRKKLGERYNGYTVTQGACTDGKYAYYMMVSKYNQKGRVLKVKLSNQKLVKRGPVIDIHHANGMTYDSKRDRLLAVGYGKWRNKLFIIDPKSLTLVSEKKVKYPYDIKGVTEASKKNGLGAIAYVQRYDVFVARSRGSGKTTGDASFKNDIWVINAENLKVIGHIYTKVTGKYPSLYQSMDADERYVYFLLSPGYGQRKNIILALDWNSEHLLPVVNGEKKFVEYTWKCNNKGTGEPDATIKLSIPYEAEGLFHTTDEDNKEHFYLTEYRGKWKYKTVTKRKAYKKKWKKVTKKVKWKKVKKNGKWKWKYKKKKVWKYKTKYKTTKYRVRQCWMRDDYVYDLGII